MKTLSKVLTALAVVSLFSIGNVNAQMAGSAHDLATNAGASNVDSGAADLCRFCHTPHNALTVAPLWDRADSGLTFTPYPSGGTMENAPGQPTGVSMGCLSCHDGVTAFDALGSSSTGPTGGNDMGTLYPSSPAILSNDLSNDHPVGVSVTVASEMELPGTITATIPLYGASNEDVECASCHDVHSTTYSYFLRLDPTAGTLCETCHTK